MRVGCVPLEPLEACVGALKSEPDLAFFGPEGAGCLDTLHPERRIAPLSLLDKAFGSVASCQWSQKPATRALHCMHLSPSQLRCHPFLTIQPPKGSSTTTRIKRGAVIDRSRVDIDDAGGCRLRVLLYLLILEKDFHFSHPLSESGSTTQFDGKEVFR